MTWRGLPQSSPADTWFVGGGWAVGSPSVCDWTSDVCSPKWGSIQPKWWNIQPNDEQLRSSKPVQFPNFSWFKCKLLLHMRKQLKTRVDFVVYINVSKTLIACFSLKNIRFAQLKTQTFAGANPVDWCFGFTACGIAGPSPRHVHASPIRASIDCSLCRWSEPCIISVLHVSVLL